MKKKITIFTPTFNRAHLIPKLYNYLLREQYKSFEWLIIDDGSSDQTKTIIEGYISDGIIDINYYYQENGGKHKAYNKAIREAKGEYFICIDSDDIYIPNALKELSDLSEEIKDEKYAGICYLSSYENGKIIGTRFPYDNFDSDLISIYYYHHVKGDKGIMFKTKVLKNYEFPIIENENFMTETVLYSEISKKYQFKFINKIYEIKEYQNGGLTEKYRTLVRNNPKGALLNYSKISMFKLKGSMKYRNIIQQIRFIFINKSNWRNHYKESKYKFSFVILTPLGFFLSR